MSPPKRRKRPAADRSALGKSQQQPVNSPRHFGNQAPRLAADPRFRRRVEAFWQFGPGLAVLLLARLADEHDCRPQIERYLDSAIEHSDAIRRFGLGREAAP